MAVMMLVMGMNKVKDAGVGHRGLFSGWREKMVVWVDLRKDPLGFPRRRRFSFYYEQIGGSIQKRQRVGFTQHKRPFLLDYSFYYFLERTDTVSWHGMFSFVLLYHREGRGSSGSVG
jgi:hypothetical protein